MKRGLALPVAIAVFAAGASLWAGNVTWRGVDGVWDGRWNDSAHWSNATDPTGLPAAGDYSYIHFVNGGTVSIPNAGVTTQAEMRWYTYAGMESSLDATGSSFTIGAADPAHPYGTDSNKRPWYMWLDNISLGWISYNVSSYEDIKYLSVLQLVNAKMTTRGTLGECAEHGKYLVRVKLRFTEEEDWCANRILYAADEEMAAYYKTKSTQTRRRGRRRKKRAAEQKSGDPA